MMTAIKIRDLFEEFSQEDPFPEGINDEVEAVSNGKKAIASYVMSLDELDTDEYVTLANKCLTSGLLVTTQIVDDVRIPKGHEQAYVFVHQESESWRIPAFRALMSISRDGYAWSDGLEVLQSKLLGYPQENINTWISSRRRQHVSWSGITVYVLMSLDQKKNLSRFGRRCFDPSADEDLCLIYATDVLVPKSELPLRSETVLARIAIRRHFFDEIFTEVGEEDDIYITSLGTSRISSLNQALCSPVEFWAGDEWS